MKRALVPLAALVLAVTALPAASASVAPTEGRNVSSATSPRGGIEDTLISLQGLPKCPTGAKANQLLTRFPLDEKDHGGIVPLGNLMPTSHTLPTAHMYVSIAGTTYLPQIPGQPPEVAPGNAKKLYAPGKMWILRLGTFSTIFDDGTVYEEFDYWFGLCNQVKGRFGHVSGISSKLLKALKGVKPFCYGWDIPGMEDRTYRSCQYKNLKIALAAGELIGDAGGHNAHLDFKLVDMRRPDAKFANQSRWLPETARAVCFLDYYPAKLKEKFYGFLGNSDLSIKRTVEPRCGQIAQDVAGTAKGAWLYQVTGWFMGREDDQLALVNDNIEPQYQVVSMGAAGLSKGIPSGRWRFIPQKSGQVNRDFSQVTPDGKVYCYDDGLQEAKVLITMPSATKLRVGTTTGSCTGTLTIGDYVEFDR
ncbi:MAG: hypothetical protein ACKOMX_11620 [Actinomycetota bacterium]